MPSDEDAAVLQLRAEMEALKLKLAAAEANAAAARESRHDTSQGAYLDDAACARSEAEHIFHAMRLDPSARNEARDKIGKFSKLAKLANF